MLIGSELIPIGQSLDQSPITTELDSCPTRDDIVIYADVRSSSLDVQCNQETDDGTVNG